ncbi:MAG: hypothetical protein ACTHQQ_15620, partial [Solirubrobacteraceae bacterium]
MTALDARLVELVSGYSARVSNAVLEQHEGASISSPLGIWVLLCACLVGAEDPERVRLEEATGCSAGEAARLLGEFAANVPKAVKAALALWVRPDRVTEAFRSWAARLPGEIEVGPMPTQAQADAWANRNTLGLISTFPADLKQMLVLLASAIATRVSWEHPFEVAAARERFAPDSPWIGAVERVLFTELTMDAAIVETSRAGLVAVYEAVAQEDLTVICVAADPTVDRQVVLGAAHEVAAHVVTGEKLVGCSLFDLPVGEGHSWAIVEQERPAWEAGQRFERITEVALPAWEIEGKLDLLRSDAFGADVATDVLQSKVVGPGFPYAKQVALATFDRYGFKAAAVTAIARAISAPGTPTE